MKYLKLEHLAKLKFCLKNIFCNSQASSKAIVLVEYSEQQSSLNDTFCRISC